MCWLGPIHRGHHHRGVGGRRTAAGAARGEGRQAVSGRRAAAGPVPPCKGARQPCTPPQAATSAQPQPARSYLSCSQRRSQFPCLWRGYLVLVRLTCCGELTGVPSPFAHAPRRVLESVDERHEVLSTLDDAGCVTKVRQATPPQLVSPTTHTCSATCFPLGRPQRVLLRSCANQMA